jgi:hypothetical protein
MFYMNKTDRKDIYELLKKYRYVLEQYHSPLGKATNISLKIIGIKATSFIVFHMKKICLKFMKR